MSDVLDESGTYTLPVCTFLHPGYFGGFTAWSVNGIQYQPGDTITVSEDTVISAVWERSVFSNADATETVKKYRDKNKGDFANSYYVDIDSGLYIIPTGLKWTVTNDQDKVGNTPFTAPLISGGTVRFGFIITGTEDELNKVQKVELNAQ